MGEEVVLVLLAGGKSTRMGWPKGLLPFRNRLWMEDQIHRFVGVGSTVYIGLGYDSEAYLDSIPFLKNSMHQPFLYHDMQIRTVINKSPENGSFSTLQTVLKAIPTTHRIFIQPIDVPLVTKNTLHSLIKYKNEIIIPRYQQKNGHPVFISRDFHQYIKNIENEHFDQRLDHLIKLQPAENITYIEIEDQQCILNLNTTTEWEMYIGQNHQLLK